MENTGKKIIKVLIFLFICNITAYPFELKFKFSNNQNFDLTTDIKCNYYLNGKYLKENNLIELSNIKINSINNNKAEINQDISVIEEKKLLNKEKYKTVNKYNLNFQKDSFGNIEGLDNINGFHDYLKFPNEDIKVGKSWGSTSFYNILLLTDSKDIKINMNVKYTCIDYQKENDKENGFDSF